MHCINSRFTLHYIYITPGDTLHGGDRRPKITFLWLNSERTPDKRRRKVQKMSSEETTAKKGHHFLRWWLKRGRQIFSRKNRVTPISCRPQWHQPYATAGSAGRQNKGKKATALRFFLNSIRNLTIPLAVIQPVPS